MISFGSRSKGEARRRSTQALGGTFHKGEWMESGEDPVLSPTISLIEQPPNFALEAHFHKQNQFQLFVGGAGSIGPAKIKPLMVHYAGAYTVYGPVISGPEGLRYFTIRPVCESGALSLKDDRDKMMRGPKRHATSAPIELATDAVLTPLTSIEATDVIPIADDGLGARLMRLPQHALLRVDCPEQAEGVFVIVLAGMLAHAAGDLSQWESLFVSLPDQLPILKAGNIGADCIILFVPAKAPEYRR